MGVFNEPIVFVDIETTGVNKDSRIIEVAAFRVEDDEVVDSFHSLVNPGSPVPYYITNITGITTADVENKPYFEDIADDLQSMFKAAIFAAHNVRFDLSFVKRQLETSTSELFNPKLFCTVRLSRALYPGVRGHSLAKIIERHKLQVTARHRAYEDARVLWEFCKLAYREHGAEAFAEAVKKQLKTKTLPPNLDASAVEALQNEPGVYIFEDEAGQPVYVGKSIKLRDRVKSHFAGTSKIHKELKISQATHGLKIIKTAGEMEALLLESQLVKDMLPLYNQQLRFKRLQVILRKNLDENGYLRVSSTAVNLAEYDDLSQVYGVYPSRMSAKAALLRHREVFGLCPKLLGLESGKGVCFQYHLNRCAGACDGKEAAKDYNARVDLAFEKSKLESWPFSTPVVITELPAEGEPVSGLIVDKWCVVGRVYYKARKPNKIERTKRLFDIDTYKILRSFILKKPEKIRVEPLQSADL